MTACSALVCVPFSSSHLGFPESPRKCYSFDSSLSTEKQLGSRWVRALWSRPWRWGCAVFLLSHGCSPCPLISGSDDDRANLMWKRYLEREDSKIVGMERARQRGSRGTLTGCGRKTGRCPRGRGEGFVRRVGGGGGGQANGCEVSDPTGTFSPPLCFCLDLFVGQLKSCLKCQACGYRSTTFEVFCDLSLPIPKVGFQRVPGVDGTCGFVTHHHPAPAWGGTPCVSGTERKLEPVEESWEEKRRMH